MRKRRNLRRRHFSGAGGSLVGEAEGGEVEVEAWKSEVEWFLGFANL